MGQHRRKLTWSERSSSSSSSCSHPVGILLSSSVFAAVFTSLLNRDVSMTHDGTELGDLAETF